MNQFEQAGTEIGKLVAEKNKAYGNSFAGCGAFLALLYPDGVQPHQFTDALTLVRIFDKMKRIATQKGAFEESPYRDIAGYGILGTVKDAAPQCAHQPAVGGDCTIGGVECWQCGDYKEAGSAAVQAETTIRKVEEARKAAEDSTLVFGGDPIPRAFIPHNDEPQCNHVPFIFPACQRFMGALPGEVVKKLREEVNEVEEAYKLPYTTDLLMELYDVVHVAETAIRAICEKAKIDPMTVKAQVIQKNRLRKYYDPCDYTPAPSSLLDCAGIRCDQCRDKPACSVK